MDTQLTSFQALTLAVETAGSQSAFAIICGVGQPTISKWLQSSKRLPAEHVLKVEAATGVSRHHLRPDIYPADMPLPVAGEPAIECGEILSRYPLAGQSNKPLNLHTGSTRSVRAA